MEANDYWFSLKPHVYVEIKSQKILLYDTRSGDHIESTSEIAISLVEQLYRSENMVALCNLF